MLGYIDLIGLGAELNLEGFARAVENLLARRIVRSGIESEEVPIDGFTNFFASSKNKSAAFSRKQLEEVFATFVLKA
jgi:hypothetical protein